MTDNRHEKVREGLRTARETTARVLGGDRRTTPPTAAELAECPQVLDEVIRFLQRLPHLKPDEIRDGAPIALAGVIEVRDRLRAGRR